MSSPLGRQPSALPSVAAHPQPQPRAKRPRLTSQPPEDHDDSDQNHHQQAPDSPPGSIPGTAVVAPPLAQGQPRRQLKPYRLRPGQHPPNTTTSAVHAQAALLRDRLLDDLQAEADFLAGMSESVAAEYSRALIEQYHLRATYAQWASLPDSDPFWTRPDVLLHFASLSQPSTTLENEPEARGDSDLFPPTFWSSAPPSGSAPNPAEGPQQQDLFTTLHPGETGDNDYTDADDLASLFAYLPVPSSVSASNDNDNGDPLCLNPLDLDLDGPGAAEEPPLDLDTLEELLGLSGESPGEADGERGYRPPPTPSELIHELAGRRESSRLDKDMAPVDEGEEQEDEDKEEVELMRERGQRELDGFGDAYLKQTQ